MRLLRSWIRDRVEAGRERLDLHELTEEIEAGLRDIDFDEVTLEDRAAFVEYAVVWQVRRALRSGQFDLALALQRFGVERIAGLPEDPHGLSADRPRIVSIHSRPRARAND